MVSNPATFLYFPLLSAELQYYIWEWILDLHQPEVYFAALKTKLIPIPGAPFKSDFLTRALPCQHIISGSGLDIRTIDEILFITCNSSREAVIRWRKKWNPHEILELFAEDSGNAASRDVLQPLNRKNIHPPAVKLDAATSLVILGEGWQKVSPPFRLNFVTQGAANCLQKSKYLAVPWRPENPAWVGLMNLFELLRWKGIEANRPGLEVQVLYVLISPDSLDWAKSETIRVLSLQAITAASMDRLCRHLARYDEQPCSFIPQKFTYGRREYFAVDSGTIRGHSIGLRKLFSTMLHFGRGVGGSSPMNSMADQVAWRIMSWRDI
jgi:hypothetical protein